MTGLDQRFKIKAPLRCNGIGRLESALDTDTGMRMAVRWLPIEANGAAAVRACEQLPNHPTLPRIRKTGQVGASAFVAMDFPEGRLLSTWEEEAVSPDVLVRLAAQIADALATIHSQGVFHGEISPDSILLVGEGEEKAYLWDMPLVIANRLTDRRGEDRLMSQLVRTAAFLSPERARGGGTSAQADVYALGAVLCLSGGSPRPSSATTLGMVFEVANGDWAPVVPDVFPDSLRAMVTRMVALDANARPSAREVAETFARPMAAMPTLREMKAVVLPADPILIAPPQLKPRIATPLPQPKPSLPEVAKFQAPLPALPELPMPPVPSPDVALAENIAVSPELLDAGAQSFSPEEAAMLFRPRLSKPLVAAAVAMFVVLMGLTYAAVSLAKGDEPRAPAPERIVAPAAAPKPVVHQPVVANAPEAAPLDEDELAPLTLNAKGPRATATRRAARPAAKTTQVRADVARDPQPEQFEFLEQNSEKPVEELKRPTF